MPITNPAYQCRTCKEFSIGPDIHDRKPQSSIGGICTTCLLAEYRSLKRQVRNLKQQLKKQHGKKKR